MEDVLAGKAQLLPMQTPLATMANWRQRSTAGGAMLDCDFGFVGIGSAQTWSPAKLTNSHVGLLWLDGANQKVSSFIVNRLLSCCLMIGS